jgi:hypothetical protein
MTKPSFTAEHPVLFMPSEAQCYKATQAKDEFETGAGATLLQERDPECMAPTTTTTTTTPPTITLTTGKCDTLDACLSAKGRETSGTDDDKRNTVIGISSKAGQCTVAMCQEMQNDSLLQLCDGCVVAGNGMGTQCSMYNKENMGPLTSGGQTSGYQGCHEKLNGWAKISSEIGTFYTIMGNKFHRRCHCPSNSNVDCKAMCAGDEFWLPRLCG